MDFNKLISGKNPLLYKLGFYLILLTVTLIGFYKGVVADTGSKDAQWYPAKLFSENIDFYNYYLEHFNEWFMRSVPNYYFQLYYILLPISFDSWDSFKVVWFFLNLLLLLVFLFQVKKDFGFDYKKMGLIMLPFFIGYPLISVFTNGQSTILILILTYLAWKYREHKVLLPILLSLLTIKYSFGIPIVFGFLLMGYYRSVIAGGLLTLIFPLAYSLQFKLNFISTIFLPFKVSTDATANATGGGPANLMSLYSQFFEGPLVGLNALTISLVLILMLFTYLSIKYRIDKKTILVCSLLFSLFGFYHNGHDYVVFLLVLPFVFNRKYFKILYVYLLLFCFTPRILRILDLITNEGMGVKEFMYNRYFVIFNVSVLMAYFFLLIKEDIQAKKKGVAAGTPPRGNVKINFGQNSSFQS